MIKESPWGPIIFQFEIAENVFVVMTDSESGIIIEYETGSSVVSSNGLKYADEVFENLYCFKSAVSIAVVLEENPHFYEILNKSKFPLWLDDIEVARDYFSSLLKKHLPNYYKNRIQDETK